ncbi:MAG: DUF1592 domain-containing protein [Deltaproteobacteria bacterium]|nr:DUF1592 domain-containing protein [Deltaproteobacteria bacterium]
MFKGFTAAIFLAALASCTGDISGAAGPRVPPGVNPLTDAAGLGPSGARRLTRDEYRQTLSDLLQIDPGADIELLPADDRTPFDNDYTTQLPSRSLVDAIKAIADRTTSTAMADAVYRASLLGCEPVFADDESCLRTFIAAFGRRALRRPLSAEELDEYAQFIEFARDGDDFYIAVDMVVRALLQDVEFIYRIEVGDPVQGRAGVFRLTDFELAARLSYFLWGSTPDDWLLDAAAAGELWTSEGREGAVTRMMQDPRATARVQSFHAQWMGYDDIPVPGDLGPLLRAETDALVARVVLEERRNWHDLFTFEETFVDTELADHYGLTRPDGSEGWVNYGDGGRGGILSHGSFLSGGAKFGDTSPVLRGILVRERLLCTKIPPPDPSLNVNTDEPPVGEDPNACKVERYAMHASGGCAGCHSQTDPIGFGLENYGPAGAFREHDIDRPECAITGDGELVGVGSFNGPRELGQLLVESGELDPCLVEQFHRFVVGRPARAEDVRVVDALTDDFVQSPRFDALLTRVALSEAFGYRVEE